MGPCLNGFELGLGVLRGSKLSSKCHLNVKPSSKTHSEPLFADWYDMFHSDKAQSVLTGIFSTL